MTPEEFSRTGVHPEHGPYSVDRWLEIYGKHAHNHAEQITRARAGARRALRRFVFRAVCCQ